MSPRIAAGAAALWCALAATTASAAGAAAGDSSEAVFKRALDYTVQVRASVSVPFIGDRKGSGLGAGFVVDAERGWIMTNAHVVSRSPARVEVAFHGGEFVPASKVWVDPYMDVAIVAARRPDGVGGVVPEFECETFPPVGHPVGAFGHPWRLPFTGTRGIISGITARFSTELLQTDAPINQGNSGGPLISLENGRIIGINTAGIRGAQNTNFAVAMPYACRILTLLQAGEDPSPPDHGLVFFRDIDERKELRVARAYARPGSMPFAPGDLILEVLGVPGRIDNETRFVHALRGRLAEASVRVRRGPGEIVLNGAKRPMARVTDRQGVYASGVLFGPQALRDAPEIGVTGPMIHHVEPGSIGQALQFQRTDVVESVDGTRVDTLDALYERLEAARSEQRRVSIELKRLGGGQTVFTYLQRSLPVRGLRRVGANADDEERVGH